MTNFVGYRIFKGTSKKSGRDYNFIACHFVDDSPADKYISGYETFTANVNGDFDIAKLNSMLGSAVNIVYNRKGAVCDMNPVKA